MRQQTATTTTQTGGVTTTQTGGVRADLRTEFQV
jgi:hypothetical protein